MTRPPVAPPGWPAGVRPPAAPDWERSAVAWLYDQCPPDYRGYDVLRRHPVVLAHLASASAAAAVAATDAALRTARRDLADLVAPDVVAAAVAAYERERLRLRATARAVELVGQALRGRRWNPRL